MSSDLIGAPARASAARLSALALLVTLAACGGGGGDSGAPAPAPSPAAPPPSTAVLTVAADTQQVAPDGGSSRLTSTVGGVPVTADWSLDGPGRLEPDPAGGERYVPPDGEQDDDGAQATITATAHVSGRQLTSAPVQITVLPVVVPGHHWDVVRAADPEWMVVGYGSGRFAAVGFGGELSTSTDGSSWSTPTSLGDFSPLSLVWGPAGWVVVGHPLSGYTPGTFVEITSTDGVHWSAPQAAFSGSPDDSSTSLTTGNGIYLASMRFGDRVSSDGVTWTAVAGAGSSGAAFGAGRFVRADAAGGLSTSTDGVAWQRISAVPNVIRDVAWGNGVFLSCSTDCYRSTDGLTWTPTGAAFYGQIVFAGDRFYGTDATHRYESADGGVWTVAAPVDPEEPIFGMAASQDKVVRVSQYGRIDVSDIAIEQFQVVRRGSYGDITALDIVGTQRLAATSLGYAMTSTDSVNWTATYMGGRHSLTGVLSVKALTHRGALRIAVGMYTDSGTTTGRIVSSMDGVSWSVVTDVAAPLEALTDDGTTFMAIGAGGEIYTSTDGTGWQQMSTLSATGILSVSAGAGHFVAQFDSGDIEVSTDGASWAPVALSPSPQFMGAVRFDGTQFLITALSGTYTSPDGLQWTTTGTYPPGPGPTASHDGEWIATSYHGIASSRDQTTWTQRWTQPPWTFLNCMAWDGTGFLAVGAAGVIVRSTH